MPEQPHDPQAHGHNEKWISLMRVHDQESAAIIEGLLENEGIECEVIDKQLSEMPLPVEGIAYVEIWVPEARAADARAILNESREGTAPCQACGHMSATDEPVCEYCGAAR